MSKENLTQFYAKYRLMIFPVIVGLASLFLITFVIYPQAIKLITNQRKEEDLISRSKLLEDKVSALEGYNGEDLSQKLNDTLSAYPADKDFGNIVGLLQQLSGQSGFTITSINVSGSPPKGPNLAYDIKMEATGAKPLIPILFANLENSPRLLKINTISINYNGQQIANVSLTISVLYSPLPQNLAGADSPLPQLTAQDQQLLARLTTASPSQMRLPSNVPLLPRGKSNPFE